MSPPSGQTKGSVAWWFKVWILLPVLKSWFYHLNFTSLPM